MQPGYHTFKLTGNLVNAKIFKEMRHVIPQVVRAIALYSASAEDLATTLCFFDFQDIGESPKRMQ